MIGLTGGHRMEALLKDVRYGIRLLVSQPGFAIVAVLALALGIGANTAIFSAVNSVLLRPLQYQDPDRLVKLTEKSDVFSDMSISYPNFVDWRQQSRSFEQMAAYRWRYLNFSGMGDPERIMAREVSANFFSVLGVKPALGRAFLAEEDRVGGDPVAVMSDGYWRRRFGRDPNLLGKTFTLDDRSYTLIGILPRDFKFYSPTDLFVPIGQDDGIFMKMRETHPGIRAIARLSDGVSMEQARGEMESIARGLAEQYPN